MDPLQRVGVFATGDGPQAISLSDDGRFLAVGHGTVSATTEQLRIFEVNSDASLAPLFTGLVPDSPLDVQWLSQDTLAVTETDFSDSLVRVYKYEEQANLLTEIDSESREALTRDSTYRPTNPCCSPIIRWGPARSTPMQLVLLAN